MASLLKDSRLSTGVLSMRFMQRKAEVELAERLGGESKESQWHGAGISLPSGLQKAGPTIVYDQRRDNGAARSYSRRSFGSFNSTVEATEASEVERHAEQPAEVEPEQPEQKKARQGRDDIAVPADSQTRFRVPADTESMAPTAPGEKPGGWRQKLDQRRKDPDAGAKHDSEMLDKVTVGSQKNNKKRRKKKRKMSAT